MFVRGYSTANVVNVPLKLYSLEGRYATALYCAAVRNNKLADVEGDLQRVKQTVAKSSVIQTFLSDPTLNRDAKKTTILEVLKEKRHSEMTINFFKVLAENGRLDQTMRAITSFEEIMRAHRHELPVCITTAKDLSNEALNQIKELVAKKFVAAGQVMKLSTKVSPSIMGGMVIQIGDRTIDMSVSSRIINLNKALNEPV